MNNGFIPDDARSHISHMSQKSARARSLADGQSQRSYSALSAARSMGMGIGPGPYITPLGLSRPGNLLSILTSSVLYVIYKRTFSSLNLSMLSLPSLLK